MKLSITIAYRVRGLGNGSQAMQVSIDRVIVAAIREVVRPYDRLTVTMARADLHPYLPHSGIIEEN